LMHAHGGPEVLRYEDAPDPVPQAGEVLVRVRACALNHLDVWTRLGQAGRPVPLPHILGNDIAGEIAALGSPVPGLGPGQRVMLSPGVSCGRCRMCLAGEDSSCREYRILGYQLPGGYAELVRCPAANVIPLPDGISFEDAAAFPLVFLTAWRMLVRKAGVHPGEDVVVWAAGSGVGVAAIQIARHIGARVLVTSRSETKRKRALELGADAAFDSSAFSKAVREATGDGVEVVFEHVGPATLEESMRSLAMGGRIVTCGSTSGVKAEISMPRLFFRHASLLGSTMGNASEFEALLKAIDRGLRPVVDSVYPLEDVQAALTRLDAAEQFGMVVLSVAS